MTTIDTTKQGYADGWDGEVAAADDTAYMNGYRMGVDSRLRASGVNTRPRTEGPRERIVTIQLLT